METKPTMRDNIFTTLSIVENLAYVESFDLFLQKILPEATICSMQRDMPFYKDLVVASNTMVDFKNLISMLGPQTRYQYEIVNESISILLKKGKVNYVQTFGQKVSGGNIVVCDYFNLSNKALIASEFERCLDKLGDQLMLYILNELMIFQRFDKQFYAQLCGPVILDLYTQKENNEKNNATKNWLQSYLAKKSMQIKDSKKEFHARVNRNLIFFCSHMNRSPGLFKNHIFEKIRVIDEFSVDEIVKKIFSTKPLNKESLFAFSTLLGQAILNYRKLNFNALFSKYCKLPDNYKELKCNVRKQTMHYSSQAKEESAPIFNELFANSIPYEKVFLLMRAIIRSVFPINIFGEENMKVLLHKTKKFIFMKRFETFLISDLLTEFNVLKLPWLHFNFNKKYAHLIGLQNQIYMTQLINWMFYDFIIPMIRANFYVTERHAELNRIFYYRKPIWKLVSKLALKFFEERNMSMISHEEKEKRFKSSKDMDYPVSKLRILPKKDTFRPIMTFFRKPNKAPKTNQKKKTMNQILNESQVVLRTLKERLGVELGFSVFDNAQIFDRYSKFLAKWKQIGSPKLYFVTMDIKKCYDSIDTKKLLEFLLSTSLLDEEYMICKYGALLRNKNKIPEEHKKKHPQLASFFNYKERATAIQLRKFGEFKDYFKESYDKNIAMFFDLVHRTLISKDKILQHIEYICERHLILYENRYYVQKRGIPQGLNISAILSSFYYAMLEEKYLGFLRKDVPNEANLLMRLTDDYLFVTTNVDKAMIVIKRLTQCARDNNFDLNEEKVKTNFPFSLFDGKITRITSDQEFLRTIKWCGKIINTMNFEIIPGFEVIEEKMFFSVNVKLTSQNTFNFIKNKFKSFLLNHSHFFINPQINCEETIQNAVIIFVKAATMKIFSFLEEMRKTRKPFKFEMTATKLILNAIGDFVQYCLKLRGKQGNKEEELLYLKICLNEIVDFFRPRKSFYSIVYNNLRKYYNRVDKALKKLTTMQIESPCI